MTHRHIEIVTTIALAVVAALFVSYVLFLFAISPRGAANPFLQQQNTPVNEAQVLSQMTPAPASAATVVKESNTLNAVSKTSANSGGASLTQDQKLNTLSSMNASQ